MKKILAGSLLVLIFTGTAIAKKSVEPRAVPTEAGVYRAEPVPVDAADLRELLELKEMYIQKYDLSGIRDTTLQVTLRIDEHFGRDSVRTVREMAMGDVWSPWDSTGLTSLKLFFVPRTDSAAMLYCNLEGRMQVGTLLKFRKAEPDFKRFNTYRPKPFKTEGMKAGEKVPVAFFGAFWYDAELSKRFGGEPAYRFCMERQMDTDMHNEAFGRMPHYWVVYIGLEKREK